MNTYKDSQKLSEMLIQIRNNLQVIVETIDLFINFLSTPSNNSDHPELYEKLNWENRTGQKGPFQMLRKDNCNNTELFNHLQNTLLQNKNNMTIGDHHYWIGEKLGYIFRRKKKDSKPQVPK